MKTPPRRRRSRTVCVLCSPCSAIGNLRLIPLSPVPQLADISLTPTGHATSPVSIIASGLRRPSCRARPLPRKTAAPGPVTHVSTTDGLLGGRPRGNTSHAVRRARHTADGAATQACLRRCPRQVKEAFRSLKSRAARALVVLESARRSNQEGGAVCSLSGCLVELHAQNSVRATAWDSRGRSRSLCPSASCLCSWTLVPVSCSAPSETLLRAQA